MDKEGSGNSSLGNNVELNFTDILFDIFNKLWKKESQHRKNLIFNYLNEEINQFFFFEFFKMSICDQEADIITLNCQSTK